MLLVKRSKPDIYQLLIIHTT